MTTQLAPYPDSKTQVTVPKRLLTGFGFLALGTVAIVIGSLSVWSRLSQLTTENALVNARVIRIRAPIEGKFKEVYVHPGMPVKAGQILARIERSPQQEQALLLLQGEGQTYKAQLQTAKQSLAQFQQQLVQLSGVKDKIANTDTTLEAIAVKEKRSGVEQAHSKVKFAHTIYNRYRSLALEGAMAQAMVEEKKADLEAAESALKGAQAMLLEQETALQARQSQARYSSSEMSVIDQRTRLLQTIQTQSSLVATLQSQLDSATVRLKQAQSLYSDRQDLVVTAPLSGVVYSSEREQSEQVNQRENVMTLLDCQDLWVEAVISAEQASHIDTHQRVQVQLAGETHPTEGEVDLIQAVSNIPTASQANPQGAAERINFTQVQALLPPVTADLAGQPLARVTVRIPPPPNRVQSRQFCGIGQIAQMTFAKKTIGF